MSKSDTCQLSRQQRRSVDHGVVHRATRTRVRSTTSIPRGSGDAATSSRTTAIAMRISDRFRRVGARARVARAPPRVSSIRITTRSWRPAEPNLGVGLRRIHGGHARWLNRRVVATRQRKRISVTLLVVAIHVRAWLIVRLPGCVLIPIAAGFVPHPRDVAVVLVRVTSERQLAMLEPAELACSDVRANAARSTHSGTSSVVDDGRRAVPCAPTWRIGPSVFRAWRPPSIGMTVVRLRQVSERTSPQVSG